MRYTLLLLSFLAGIAPAVAQQQTQPVITAADYAHAERFLSANTTPLVSGVMTRPTWLPDGRLSYRNSIPEGSEFVLADPVKRSRKRAFDHARLAMALSALADTTYGTLPPAVYTIRVFGRWPFHHLQYREAPVYL